jgi:hypothetical protein
MYLGNVSQSGFTNLSLGNGDIVCMAVNVDEIEFGGVAEMV